MKALFPLVCFAWLAAGSVASAAGFPACGTFQGKVYQVDTVYNNVDVIMPDRTRTFWADAGTKVRVHGQRAQLIDIVMGDEVRGTYTTGPKGALMVVTIEDVTK